MYFVSPRRSISQFHQAALSISFFIFVEETADGADGWFLGPGDLQHRSTFST